MVSNYIEGKKGLNLKYRIENIPSEGIELEGELEKGWLEQSFQASKDFPSTSVSTVFYNITLRRTGTTLFVSGNVRTRIETPCGRCLEPCVVPIDSDFSFSLAPEDHESRAYEKELLPEDLDTEFYEGEVIDLGKIIQTQVLLSIPIKPLCQETCQGLCPVCGANRNQEACTCTADTPGDPRLAVLKKLLKQNPL